MKKKLILTICIVLLMTFVSLTTVKANINNVPFDTYSWGLEGWLVQTATAYEGTFILNSDFENPQDIFIDHEDNVYIADTGNSRIYKYNPKTKEETIIGKYNLQAPEGVFVDKVGDIYVADSQLKAVLWFNQNGELLKKYERPTEAFFGENAPYIPQKVLVDKNKDLYVITQNSTNGIIQLDKSGEFLGYYGVNKVELSPQLYLQRILMTKEQKEKFASLKPKATTNFAMDEKGLIYTVIRNEYLTPIKKLNIRGTNVLTGFLLEEPYYRDIFVDKDGLIYVVSNNPDYHTVISVLDQQGNLIFTFGQRIAGSLKIGLFEDPSGIAVDSNGDIWVLDGGGNHVQVFTKTEFANLVLTAIRYHNNSEYEKARPLFEEVVRQNAMFSIAHSSLGKAYERAGDLDKALESYRIANNKVGYSNVYWELRDNWLEKNLLPTLGILMVAGIAFHFLKKYKEQIIGYETIHGKIEKMKDTKLYFELISLKRILRHPADVVYDIKFRQSIRIRTAIGLYVAFVVINIISNIYIRGYLFRGYTTRIVLTYEILSYLLPLLLIGIANHLINSLQNGEGYYRDIFIGIIYAFAPVFIFKIPLDLISNVLTYNEVFIMQLGQLVINVWSIINVIYVIKEINNYKFGQTMLNVVLTIFTVFVMIILYLVISVLTSQMSTFIQGIIQEVIR